MISESTGGLHKSLIRVSSLADHKTPSLVLFQFPSPRARIQTVSGQGEQKQESGDRRDESRKFQTTAHPTLRSTQGAETLTGYEWLVQNFLFSKHYSGTRT